MEAWFDFGHISLFLCRSYVTCGHGPVICSADVCLRQDTEPEGWTVTSGLKPHLILFKCVCVCLRGKKADDRESLMVQGLSVGLCCLLLSEVIS